MKALFIIHCQDPIYGASRSIGNLIRNLDADVDIIFPMKIRKDGITQEQIDTFYGSRVRNVWYLPQPLRLTALVDALGIQHHVKSFVKDILYFFTQPIYRHIYQKGQYDFIHLNSLTLYPMLKKKWPMFLHIRETAREKQNFWNRRFSERLEQAHGIIYINREIQQACPESQTPSLVLINPYDQTAVAKVDVLQTRQRFNLTGDETVYAIIGAVVPFKGVDFVIRAFRKAQLHHAVLLVVGKDSADRNYRQKLEQETAGDPRIRFLGEIEDIAAVYRIVDYVVRGDFSSGAGRTVFESLYSGGGAILQGSKEENLASMELPPALANKVHFYPIEDQEALTAVFEATEHSRFVQREYVTNVPQYVERLVAFMLRNNGRANKRINEKER